MKLDQIEFFPKKTWEPVPAGEYLVKLSDVKLDEKFELLKFEVIHGTYQGRWFFHRMWYQRDETDAVVIRNGEKQPNKKAKEFLSNFIKTLPKYEKDWETQNLIGSTTVALVMTTKNDRGEFNNITGFRAPKTATGVDTKVTKTSEKPRPKETDFKVGTELTDQDLPF